MKQIQGQVARKTTEKYSHNKKAKDALACVARGISRRVFRSSKYEVKQYTQASGFGYDESGRDIEDGLHEYVRLLRGRRVNVHTLVVLGSRAKGKWTPQSDTDVLIIADDLPKEGSSPLTKRLFSFKRGLLLSDRPLFLGIEPSGCCSGEEFLARLRSFDLQALDAMLFGRIVYDDGFWETAKASYDEMERKYELDRSALRNMVAPV